MISHISVFICILVLIICLLKFGREKTLAFTSKILSPICIILFYLSGVSIIIPIMNKFQISNIIVTSNDSVRVAVDSAIVTLFVNIVLSFFDSPIKIEVEAKSRQDLEQVVTYCNKPVRVDYDISLKYKHKRIMNMYRRFGSPVLRLINTENTSIVIEKEDEYVGIVDCSNSSKYIDVNISKIADSGKLYFTLLIQSNKTIKWDDKIKTELRIGKRRKLGIHLLCWQVQNSIIKVAHREEQI